MLKRKTVVALLGGGARVWFVVLELRWGSRIHLVLFLVVAKGRVHPFRIIPSQANGHFRLACRR